MSPLHKNLSADRWEKLPLCEQMANIGSEVGRSLNWREKDREDLSQKAMCRALELLDLTIEATRSFARLKELLRMKECLTDFYYGTNEYSSSVSLWHKYFHPFNYASRKYT